MESHHSSSSMNLSMRSDSVSSSMSLDANGNRVAFRSTVLVSNFDGKVESVSHYSSRVVVGSSDGRLVMFDTRKGTNNVACSHSFEHQRGVQQILAIPHIRMVMVISNGELSCHGATDLKPLDFDFSKANTFKVRLVCINQRGPPHFRVASALLKRRAVVIFQYHSSPDKSYKFLREFTTEDFAEAMAWYRNKLIVGFRDKYVILNDKSGDSIPVAQSQIENPGANVPVIKLLPKEECLIAVGDATKGMFIGLHGEVLPKKNIVWSQPPSAVDYTAPYVVGLLPRVGVEIRSNVDQSFIQLIPIGNATCLFGNGMKWDMDPRPSGDSEDVVIVGVREGSSSSSVMKIEPIPLDQQIGDLLDQGRVEEAQDLVKKSVSGLPTDKQRSKVKRFQRQSTIALLRRLEFDAAIDHMFRAAIEPCEYIAFFPDFQCQSFAYEPLLFKPDVLPRGNASAPPDIRAVISEVLATRKQFLASEIARMDKAKLYHKATKSLLKFLEMYKKHIKDKLVARTQKGALGGRSRSVSNSTSRDPRKQEAVDTALFRLYVTMGYNEELAALIQGDEYDSSCLDLSSCESLLRSKQLYYEAGQLLLKHGKNAEALELYRQLAAGEITQPKAQKTGEEAAIDALISLGPEDEELVLENSKWILACASSEQALRVFIDRQPASSSDAITDHLKKYSSEPSIVQKYLETLVQTNQERGRAGSFRVSAGASGARLSSSSRSSGALNSSRHDLNDSYSNYLSSDQDFYAAPSSGSGTVQLEESLEVDPHHTRLALEYLEDVLKLIQKGETPSKSLPAKDSSNPLDEKRRRLMKFLKAPTSRFEVSPLIAKCKNKGLHHEFVMICGRGGLHEDALRCLLYELNDVKGAEGYCLRYGVPGYYGVAPPTGAMNEAFLVLLRLCFKPQEEAKKAALYDLAFQILNRHGRKMDGKQVLSILPPGTPLNKLGEYFSQLLPTCAHQVREKMLTKSLSNIYNLQVQCERVSKRAQNIEIDVNTRCFACKKRIGDIVFAVYPNGKVVHYNCMNGRLDVCPVTGEKFT